MSVHVLISACSVDILPFCASAQYFASRVLYIIYKHTLGFLLTEAQVSKVGMLEDSAICKLYCMVPMKTMSKAFTVRGLAWTYNPSMSGNEVKMFCKLTSTLSFWLRNMWLILQFFTRSILRNAVGPQASDHCINCSEVAGNQTKCLDSEPCKKTEKCLGASLDISYWQSLYSLSAQAKV